MELPFYEQSNMIIEWLVHGFYLKLISYSSNCKFLYWKSQNLKKERNLNFKRYFKEVETN